MVFNQTGNLVRVPAAATDPADRETVAANVTLALPIPGQQRAARTPRHGNDGAAYGGLCQ